MLNQALQHMRYGLLTHLFAITRKVARFHFEPTLNTSKAKADGANWLFCTTATGASNATNRSR
ncbi:Uncharacterised protein [Vibrio cholerae]|nr:Uncharacterised protein [Vibrio cholerae]